MLLLPLLLACNPEHNPQDLAEIARLEDANQALNTDLADLRAERDGLQQQVDAQNGALDAFNVIGRAYQTSAKLEGNQLVVCMPPDVGDFIDATVPPPTRTVPWVQGEVTPDCGEPYVFDLSTVYSDAPEQVATADDFADGPQLTNAPVKADEEDPE